MLKAEASEKVTRIDSSATSQQRWKAIRTDFAELLTTLKGNGAHIAAYGAAAKGSTMINYSGIGTEFVDFVVDRNTHKQGLYMPGSHIPVLAPEALLDRIPAMFCCSLGILPTKFSNSKRNISSGEDASSFPFHIRGSFSSRNRTLLITVDIRNEDDNNRRKRVQELFLEECNDLPSPGKSSGQQLLIV